MSEAQAWPLGRRRFIAASSAFMTLGNNVQAKEPLPGGWSADLRVRTLAAPLPYAGGRGLAWRSDGKTIAYRYSNIDGIVVSVRDGSVLTAIPAPDDLGAARTIMYLPNTNTIVFGGGVKGVTPSQVTALSVVDGATGAVLRDVKGVQGVKVGPWMIPRENHNPTGGLQYVAGLSKMFVREILSPPSILAYDVSSWKFQEHAVQAGYFDTFCFHPQRPEFCVNQAQGGPAIVSYPSGQVMRRLPDTMLDGDTASADGVLYSQDGRYLAVWSSQSYETRRSAGRLLIFDAEHDYVQVARMGLEFKAVHSLAFHPSGTFMAVAALGHVTLFSLPGFALVKDQAIPSGNVSVIAFSPDARQLACSIAGDDAALIVLSPKG